MPVIITNATSAYFALFRSDGATLFCYQFVGRIALYIFNTDVAVLFFCVRLLQRKPLLVGSNRELRCFANCPARIAQEERGTYRDLWEQLPKRSGIHTGTGGTS